MKKPKTKKPAVSVILPVYKSEKFLESCLEGLSGQSFKKIEIIGVVDYLGDNSLKILRKYKKKEKRLRVYSNLQTYGLASTLNRAVRLSKGGYIAFMDPLAVAAKQRVSKQVKFLVKNPKVAAVGTQATILDNKGKKLEKTQFPQSHEEIYSQLLGGTSMRFETVMVDKTRLPKDILKFKRNTHYPFVYIDVLMKIGVYRQLANLKDSLVTIRENKEKTKDLISLHKRLTFIKLLFESTTSYEYKPSLKSLFSPILRQG